jgi:RNA-binding proteins (RRM domain)
VFQDIHSICVTSGSCLNIGKACEVLVLGGGDIWWRRVVSCVNSFHHLSVFAQMFINLLFLFSRDQGSKREMNEEERLLRLFCVVPKTMTDQMLRDHFKKFGDIDYVSVVKDRETKESKGFAYVKFHK